jgi:ATP synthase protein I
MDDHKKEKPEHVPGDENKDTKYGVIIWASSLGATLVFSTAIGLAIGVWLDRFLHTRPYLTMFFFLLGIVAGFQQIFRAIKRENAVRDKESHQ